MNNSDIRTLNIIREKLASFVNRRERAYKSVVATGNAVPDYKLKTTAIAALRTQLEASKSWDLQSNLRWIHAMRHLVCDLLPYEFHDDPKQILYRKHMIDLLNYCEDLLDSKPLFNPNPKAA